MKAITLHQPRASLIAMGLKTVETFGWEPPRWLHGQRMAIHAGRRQVARKDLRLLDRFKHRDMPRTFMVPYGAMVATARLVTVFRVGETTPDGMFVLCDRNSHYPELCPSSWHVASVDGMTDFTPGRYCWVFDRIELLDPPVEIAGHQGLWEWQSEHLMEG